MSAAEMLVGIVLIGLSAAAGTDLRARGYPILLGAGIALAFLMPIAFPLTTLTAAAFWMLLARRRRRVGPSGPS